eukprot:2699393-Amphidinium_carterae.1
MSGTAVLGWYIRSLVCAGFGGAPWLRSATVADAAELRLAKLVAQRGIEMPFQPAPFAPGQCTMRKVCLTQHSLYAVASARTTRRCTRLSPAISKSLLDSCCKSSRHVTPRRSSKAQGISCFANFLFLSAARSSERGAQVRIAWWGWAPAWRICGCLTSSCPVCAACLRFVGVQQGAPRVGALPFAGASRLAALTPVAGAAANLCLSFLPALSSSLAKVCLTESWPCVASRHVAFALAAAGVLVQPSVCALAAPSNLDPASPSDLGGHWLGYIR